MTTPLFQLENIHKYFGPIRALEGVHLEIQQGEIHAIIGENGAGKSTLMKILSGAHLPNKDSGQILYKGKSYAPGSPAASRKAGIAMIYQELNLAPHLTIEENVLLGLEQHRWGFVKKESQRVQEALDILGQHELSPDTLVGNLSVGKQQLIEIARALVSQAEVIIMDEPTSSLSHEDSQTLFEVIRKLKAQGITLIYISHFLEEVMELCDRYTVLRDGKTVATGEIAHTQISELIAHMVGRSVEELYPHIPHSIGEVVLEVQHVSGNPYPIDISFQLRKGEILGIAGLVGAGRSELVRSLFGLDTAQNGQMQLAGQGDVQVASLSPSRALTYGLDLLSEDRKEEGLALNLSIGTNITLSALKKYQAIGRLQLRKEQEAAQRWIKDVQIKCQSPRQPVQALSGGNQQKVCIARLLHHDSEVLFLDEPTRGIDVGSKAEIYRLIQTLASEGKSLIVVSSYLPELLGVCDSIAVMHKGKLSAVQPIAEWTETRIMQFATSGSFLPSS